MPSCGEDEDARFPVYVAGRMSLVRSSNATTPHREISSGVPLAGYLAVREHVTAVGNVSSVSGSCVAVITVFAGIAGLS